MIGGRAGLEAVRRVVVGDRVLAHLADHLAAALIGRHLREPLALAVEHADAGRPVDLVAGEDVEIGVEIAHVHVEMDRALAPSTSTGTPCAWAMRMISLIGVTVPSTFDMWVMATILVRGVISFSNSSRRKLPSSSTGAHLITAPLRSRRKCQGTMLEWCSMIERMISSPSPIAMRPKRIRHQVVGLRGRLGEDDLVDRPGVEELAHGLARALEGFRRRVGHEVQAAMDVGVARLHGVHHGVDHRARLLRRGGVVEIDQRLAVDLLRQDRELRPDRFDVVGCKGAFIA